MKTTHGGWLPGKIPAASGSPCSLQAAHAYSGLRFFSISAAWGWGRATDLDRHTPAAFSGRGWDVTWLLRPAFWICFSEGPRQSRETLRKLPARPQQHARDGSHQMHPQTSSQNPWTSSSDPTRAIQNMVHPSGASAGLGEQPRAARGAALYYRRQSLDASLPPRPQTTQLAWRGGGKKK